MPRRLRALATRHALDAWEETCLAGGVLPAASSPPRIADYELIRIIGSGSYGDVWLARGITGVFRAIKVVWRERFTDLRPYEREFAGITRFATVSVREPSQLALLHAGRSDAEGYFYYVMELADDAEQGRTINPENYVPLTLREVRDRRGRLPAAEVVALGVALSRALSTLHAEGLVHRDIKPSNVVFVGGVPKLADVGLVTAASDGVTFVGTEGYVPREGPGAPAADVYSLGKVLYELATGQDRNDWPRLPAELVSLPGWKELLELNEVLVRACEADVAKRFSDAEALLEELLLLQAGKSVRRLRATERRLSRALRVAAVFAVAAIVAGTGAFIEHRRAAKAEADRDMLRRRATYSANLARAQRAIDNDELVRARQLLEEVAPKSGEIDLRGFEWNALWHDARGNPHTVVRAPGGLDVSAIILSPDETMLAIHDKGERVALHAADTGRELLRINGVRKLTGYSSDGKWLLGADSHGAIRRWATQTGEKGPDAGASMGDPIALIGPRIVSISDGEEPALGLRVFGASEDELRIDLGPQNPGEPWKNFRSAASPDGRSIVHVWRHGGGSGAQFRLTGIVLTTPPLVRHVDLGTAVPRAIGIDSTGPWAFCDAQNRSSQGDVWRCSNTGWARSAEALPSDTRKYVEFYREGLPQAVVARGRQLAWLLEPRSTTIARTARGHNAMITDLVVSSKNDCIFSSATDGSVLKWRLSGPTAKRIDAWQTLGATNVVFTADGKGMWVPIDGTACALLETSSLTRITHVHGMVYPVSLVGNTLIGVGIQPGLMRVKAETGALIDRTMIASRPARMAAAVHGGSQMAVLDQAGELLAPGQDAPRAIPLEGSRPYLIGLSPEGTRLGMAFSAPKRELACLSWPDGALIWRREIAALASSFRFLPNRNLMIATLENGALELRDDTNGERIDSIDSGSAPPQTLAFTPDQTRLFVGGREGEIHCFDMATWKPLHTISLGREHYLHRLVCSPDGKTLAALTRAGVLHVVRTE